jgi:LysR family hydrogen peroxide-inducible transcriptional activator
MSAPHPFTLRQLQYLVAVADLLSFRKAAERCNVSQPALSAQLGELEAALEVRVFERNRRRVLLTPAGRDIVERARRLLADADALTEVARRAIDPLAGKLRLGIIPTISPYLLHHISPVLREKFPRLRPVWIEDKTAMLAAALQRGDLDAAIVALEADLGRLDAALIAADPFVLATPQGHRLSSKKVAVAPADLRGEGVLLLDDGHCFRDQALAVCEGAGALELEFRATNLSTLAQMVASGAGITLLPQLAVPVESRRAGIQLRLFSKPAPHRTIGLVWRKGSPLVGALKKIADVLRQAYPEIKSST